MNVRSISGQLSQKYFRGNQQKRCLSKQLIVSRFSMQHRAVRKLQNDDVWWQRSFLRCLINFRCQTNPGSQRKGKTMFISPLIQLPFSLFLLSTMDAVALWRVRLCNFLISCVPFTAQVGNNLNFRWKIGF